MKKLKLCDYNINMGTLIDVRHPEDYCMINNSINIYYQKIMSNPNKYLEKSKRYFIMCKKGTLSLKVVKYLEYLKYDVTLIVE